MAALNLRENQTTGELVLAPHLLPRLLGALGNLGWFVILGSFLLVSRFFDGRFDPETLIIFAIIFLLSLASSLSGFFATTVKIEPAVRMLSHTTRLLFFPIRSTILSFNDLANIQVQFYRQSSGRSSHDAYRVNGIDKSGHRISLNWDGQREEMLALAQKISAMTGAPVLDQTEEPASTLDQVIEQARNLGLPLPEVAVLATPRGETAPQETTFASESPPTTNPPEPSPEGILMQVTKAQEPIPVEGPSAVSITATEEESPAPTSRDLRGLSTNELEQRVAGDPMDSDARYTLARKYHARRQLDRAIGMYQGTLQVETTNAEAQNDLGVALEQRGRRAEAEAAYRRAIALDPFSFNAHLNLGLLLSRMNRAAEASQEFFQARQSARNEDETRAAEAASTGARMEPRLSG